MRSLRYVLVFSSLCLATITFAGAFGHPPPARKMIATIYDDGKSCPGNCDAHVVFHPSNNGTRNAFSPESQRSHPAKCTVGKQCTICFSEDDKSCMTATYRGAGPDVERFDFTPAFYEENCPKANLPPQFSSVCKSLNLAKYANKVNCILSPEDARCLTLINEAAARKSADDVLYEECKTMGNAKFNTKYAGQPAKQRTNDCAYEQLKSGHNSKGQKWHKLLDGACRKGNYVGRDGTDCCTGSVYAAAFLRTECERFFVPK